MRQTSDREGVTGGILIHYSSKKNILIRIPLSWGVGRKKTLGGCVGMRGRDGAGVGGGAEEDNQLAFILHIERHY